MGGGDAKSPGGAMGGERSAWTVQEWAKYWRQETIGGDEVFRAEKRVVLRADGDPMARECVDSAEICKGRYW